VADLFINIIQNEMVYPGGVCTPVYHTIPGTAAGMVLLKAVTVARPTSAAVLLTVVKKAFKLLKKCLEQGFPTGVPPVITLL